MTIESWPRRCRTPKPVPKPRKKSKPRRPKLPVPASRRTAGQLTLCHTLECCVSPESLPVLLRRLFELDTCDDIADAAMSLADAILMTLGFDECGEFVGKEALGLA